MNADEVCAMIDAISEGERYVLPIATDEGESNGCKRLEMRVGEESILFYLRGPVAFAGVINDSRAAREIAVALTAWADQKDRQTYE